MVDIENYIEFSAHIKERLAKYNYLRITEDKKGIHILNILNRNGLLLYRRPRMILGKCIYGMIKKEVGPSPLLLGKEQFDRAIKRLLELASQEDENKNGITNNQRRYE